MLIIVIDGALVDIWQKLTVLYFP